MPLISYSYEKFCFSHSIFSKRSAEFLKLDLNDQLCNCRASFDYKVRGNFSCIECFKDWKGEKVRKLPIFPENQTFCSPKLMAAICLLGCQSTFLKIRSYLTTKHWVFFLANETWWGKLTINWILVWFVWILKLGFSQIDCLDFFRQGPNQQLCICTKIFYNFVLSSILFSDSLKGFIVKI